MLLALCGDPRKSHRSLHRKTHVLLIGVITQSANGAFTSFDKTLYATLQSPSPTDTAVSRAPQERVLSWYDFGAEREKHTEFEALSARVKHLVGDKVIARKVAPPADELDKTFIWSDSIDHYQVRLRHNPHAFGLDNLEDLAEVLDTWQKRRIDLPPAAVRKVLRLRVNGKSMDTVARRAKSPAYKAGLCMPS